MEEEKAAAYYDELVRKGGNAAKYKQGLGFGGSQASLSKNEGYGSLSNFVKSSPGRTAALEKESRVDSIRDKLKKRDGESSSRKRSPERDRKEDHVQVEARGRRPRTRTPELGTEARKRDKSTGHRSPSSGDSDGDFGRKAGSDRNRRSRSRSRRSKSPTHRVRSATPEKDFAPKRRESELSSPSPSHGSSGSSSEPTRKRGRLSDIDRCSSHVYDSRRRHRRYPETSRSRRSRSRSEEKRRRDRSRSGGRHADRRRSCRRNGSSSPQGSRKRERSRSPASRRSSYRSTDRRYGWRVSERSRSYQTDSIRRPYEDDRRRERSYKGRDRGPDEKSRSAQGKPQERDYTKLIPNFQTMTPAEKVKAKMKLQLSETVVKDQAKGMSDEWERFEFNKDAPLDDDAKQDYFGDGTGALDDTEFLKNTGSTFLSSTNQVTREAQVQSLHDNAIFGPPQGLRIRVSKSVSNTKDEKNGHTDNLEDQPVIVEEGTDSRKDESGQGPPVDSAHPVSSVVSQQVIAMQQAGSWQERARKMREARAALDS